MRVTRQKTLGLIALALSAAVLFYFYAPFDRPLSDLFYRDGAWLWPKENETLSFWLHNFLRDVFIAIGVISVVIVIAAQFKPSLQRYHITALLLALALIATPVSVSILKKTNTAFCPDKLERYGGSVPDDYKMQLAAYRGKGHCYPASHPSGGFSLMVLGVIATTRRRRILGYGAGLLAGGALTFIQLGRGEHFLSHCIVTALVALAVSHVLAYFVVPLVKRKWQWQ